MAYKPSEVVESVRRGGLDPEPGREMASVFGIQDIPHQARTISTAFGIQFRLLNKSRVVVDRAIPVPSQPST